jgi:hypothetical protein
MVRRQRQRKRPGQGHFEVEFRCITETLFARRTSSFARESATAWCLLSGGGPPLFAADANRKTAGHRGQRHATSLFTPRGWQTRFSRCRKTSAKRLHEQNLLRRRFDMKLAMFARYGVLTLIALSMGCASYYQITDQVSKRVYYTTDYDRTDSGAVQFKDARTRADVTLQSSEIIEISRPQYEAGLKP